MKEVFQLLMMPASVVRGYEILNTEDFTQWEQTNPVEHSEFMIGEIPRGIFITAEEIAVLLEEERDVYGLHEGYYDYALIVRTACGQIDPDQTAVAFYKWEQTKDVYTGKYVKIEIPESIKNLY